LKPTLRHAVAAAQKMKRQGPGSRFRVRLANPLAGRGVEGFNEGIVENALALGDQ
jgi:hypothetical protein